MMTEKKFPILGFTKGKKRGISFIIEGAKPESNKKNNMKNTQIKSTHKTQDTTVGSITTREEAQRTADHWRNPAKGFHTQVIEKDGGYICRLVVND